MSGNLYVAHHQWRSRPDDQRYQTLEALEAACELRRQYSHAHRIPAAGLRAVADGGDVRLLADGASLALTHWSFGQLAERAGAPARYLRTLPAELAAPLLEHGLTERAARDARGAVDEGAPDPFAPVPLGYTGAAAELEARDMLYVATPPGEPARLQALTGAGYGRVYCADMIRWIREEVAGTSFHLPRAYSVGGKFGGDMVPSGAYASDHDSFVFLVDGGERGALNADPKSALNRGFIVSNSEVGARSLRFLAFAFREVCGNHIVWGARVMRALRLRHQGRDAEARAERLVRDLIRRYMTADSSIEARAVEAARGWAVASSDVEAVEWLREQDVPLGVARGAVELAVREEGGAGTAWELVQGVTAMARAIRHQDRRTEVEAMAGAILDTAAVRAGVVQ